jgi:hypothetical protein
MPDYRCSHCDNGSMALKEVKKIEHEFNEAEQLSVADFLYAMKYYC